MTAFQPATRDGDAALIVNGDIDIATSEAFFDALCALVASAHSPAFVDLSNVTYIDSSGLNALVRVSRTVQEDVTLVLVAPSAPVRKLLALSGLEGRFEVRE
jgi:anti-sigma B factor antagonist